MGTRNEARNIPADGARTFLSLSLFLFCSSRAGADVVCVNEDARRERR